MRQWILGGLFLLIVASAAAQDVRRYPSDTSVPCLLWGDCREWMRLMPADPTPYLVPRSVGVNVLAIDMSVGPLPWWGVLPGSPNWVTADYIYSRYDITALGLMLAAHPFINYTENIRKLFRSPSIDILVIRPEHWGSRDYVCDGDGGEYLAGVLWENYPVEIYGEMYHYYYHQNKDIFITNTEADWQAYGVSCRDRQHCIKADGAYDLYYDACEAGTLVPYDTDAETCEETACDMVKMDRAEYLLGLFDERQTAAMEARAAHPASPLNVWHTIEVNFFNTQDWQFFTILGWIIPRMTNPPDFISFSLYGGAGDPVEALHYAMEMTGLPVERFFISEVGKREQQPGDQYDRIVSYVDALFAEGVAFALVWDLEIAPAYNTGYSVVNRETGEWYSGMTAIKELNDVYR